MAYSSSTVGEKAVLTIPVVYCVIYNKWEINPEYKRVLS